MDTGIGGDPLCQNDFDKQQTWEWMEGSTFYIVSNQKNKAAIMVNINLGDRNSVINLKSNECKMIYDSLK